MDFNNLTVVVFIENYYQEKLLLLNPVISSFHVLVVYSQIKPQYFRCSESKFALTMETEAVSFEQALPNILDKIDSEWMLYLKPEEKMPFINKSRILDRPYYFLKIVTTSHQLPSNEESLEQLVSTHCYELRLFNKAKLLSGNFNTENPENSCLNITVNNYSLGFPELEKFKLNKYVELYKNGDKRLSVILYLFQKNYIEPEIIFTVIENMTQEESKSAEALGLYCRVAEILIEQENFTEAKKILGKALKYFPNSPAANYLLADIYFREVEFTHAISFLKKCIDLGENNYYKFTSFPTAWINYDAYYRLGNIYLKLNALSKAREAFENSLVTKPDCVKAKEKLDFIENELSVSPGKSKELDFACQSCGNCCRDKEINITHSDLERILENRSDLQADDFIEYSTKHTKNSNIAVFSGEFFTGESNSPQDLTIPEEEKNVKKWMLLKKKPESTDCIFLTEDIRCGIHPFKPIVCKVWPFSLRENDKSIVWAKSNREFIKTRCAHTLVKGSNNAEELKSIFKEYIKDREEYLRVIFTWNREAEISNTRISDSDFIKFLLEKTAVNINRKKQNLLNNVLDILKQDNRVKLIIDSPFASEYFPRIDNDLFLGLYIDDNSISSFQSQDNIEELKIKFKAESYFLSTLPVKAYNFYFEDVFVILYIYPESYLNEGTYQSSKILHNLSETKIKLLSDQGMLETELKRIYQGFNNSLDEAVKNINDANYDKSFVLLMTMVNDFLVTMLCWLNKKEFYFMEIPNLKNKTADLKDFFIDLFDYIYDHESQMNFAKKLADIFERNWQLLKIEKKVIIKDRYKNMSETHSFDLKEKTIEILGILSSRTKKDESDLLEEALAYLFEEYKELISDTDETIEIKFGPGSKGVSDG